MISHRRRLASSLAAAAFSMLSAFACATAPDELDEPADELAPAELGERASTVETLPPSCWDQCYWAGQTCPVDCRVSVPECQAATATCYDSCEHGVGPWLPC
jgi:hypothetical protein